MAEVEETVVRFVAHSTKPQTANKFRFEEKPEPGKPPVMGGAYIEKWFLEGADTSEVEMVLRVKRN